jgi:pimeloyl-ACP methyl ester carboxylesterase
MKMFVIAFIVLCTWLIIAPGCMTMRKPDREWKAKFQKEGISLITESKKINGHTLHYAKTGNDSFPTIVFVHGTPGSWDAFEGYLGDTDLLRKYRLISVDRPGFGYSDFGDVFHLQEQSAIISPVLQQLKNGRPIFLVGHSLGGPLAVKICADNPQLFSSLVILAGSTDPAQEKPEKWRPVLFKTPLNFLIPGALKPSNEELWYLKKDLVDLKNDFEKVYCPVYIFHGRKDVLVPFANAAYSKKMLVNAAHISELYFPEENHFIPWTQFDAIKKVLLSLNQ